MQNIYLVGFMGTGKTVVGKELAKRLNRTFFDLDELIESREGRRISEIFSKKGEAYFRQVEKTIVKEVAGKNGCVVACGGGVVLDAENMRALSGSGMVICLTASAQAIFERTQHTADRPLLNVIDQKKQIAELLEKRAPFYAQAQYTIDTTTLNAGEVAEAIIRIVKADENKKSIAQ